MSISLVPCGEEFTKVIDGVEFRLHRLTEQEELELRRNHTQRGILDEAGYTRALLRQAVRGWGSGITSPDGQEYAYQPDRVWSLPDSVKAEILRSVVEGRPTIGPGPS